jgi:hypothetical protein
LLVRCAPPCQHSYVLHCVLSSTPFWQVASRNEYDKTIMETEAAYMKILESSQTLLHVLKRESVSLTKKKQASA